MTVDTSPDQDVHASDRHPRQVRVTVNHQAVLLPKEKLTGLEIKEAAIAQGVHIALNFSLSVKVDGRHKPVPDNKTIEVHAGEEFLAVDPDENS